VNVAFLGLGIMGSRMAANLRAAGHHVVVWNRTREKADALGDPVAATAAEAAAAAEVVITMLVDGPQVEAVLAEAAEAAAEGTLFVDMSTIAPGRRARPRRGARGERAALRRRAGDRLVAEGRGRDADDHGLRRAGGRRRGASALRGDG
jgi:3-hydroxyisobutyrate dehydrogenase-like beta-hydroxyacid dehydrogenase